MTDEEIKKLIQHNEKLCMLVGIASAIIFNHENIKSNAAIDWLKRAIQDVIYKDEKIPEFSSNAK